MEDRARWSTESHIMVFRKQSKTRVVLLQRHTLTLNNSLPSATPHFSVSITSKNITTIWGQGTPHDASTNPNSEMLWNGFTRELAHLPMKAEKHCDGLSAS